MHAWERWLWRAPLLALIALLAVWAADRTPPVAQVHNQSEGLARPGGEAVIVSIVDRKRLCQTRVSRAFVDARGERTIYPAQEFAPPEPPGLDHYWQRLPVPESAAPGPGVIAFGLAWTCNPLHMAWPIRETIKVRVVVDRAG